MEENYDEFISEAVDILVDLLKGSEYETVRRINYLVKYCQTGRLKEIIE